MPNNFDLNGANGVEDAVVAALVSPVTIALEKDHYIEPHSNDDDDDDDDDDSDSEDGYL